MQHYHSLENLSIKNAWLTIGVFDGVHRGHAEIIKQLVAGAHAQNEPAVALTFNPHPISVLTGRDIQHLTTPSERATRLHSLGVDMVITQQFDAHLASLSALEYMSTLQHSLGLKQLLIGYDFALGKGREGNAARLTEIGKALNYEVQIISVINSTSGVISSTAIRKLIAAGDVRAAADLLGYKYQLSGEVIRGAGRGRALNIPTANVDYPKEKATPPNGIYICWATLGNERFMAATNIGFNPTFTPERQTQSLEAHLLDFDRDIYGQTLTLEFVARLRDELKFDSIDALLTQIWDDIKKTREMLTKE